MGGGGGVGGDCGVGVCAWGGGVVGGGNLFVETVVGLLLHLSWLISMDEYIEWIRAQ